jgi:G3E family GTPase
MPGGKAEADTRIPVTVVTGYLGAGKTTLLNHLLTQTSDWKIAVIVNEFGDAGIDGELIESGAEDLIELSSGCICCVVRGDLIRTLRSLARSRPDLDAVLIETTGLANPSPVIQTFSVDQILAARFRLDSVVTVVDALHIVGQLAASRDAADQIALADLIVLNKADEAGDIDVLAHDLRRINPFAPILPTTRGRVAAVDLLDRHSFDLARLADRMATTLPEPDHHHSHTDGIHAVSVQTDAALDAEKLETWLRDMLALNGPDMLRIKGIIDVAGAPRKLVLQAVNMLLEGGYAGPWPADQSRNSRIVFIGRNLDPTALRAGVLACAPQPAP